MSQCSLEALLAPSLPGPLERGQKSGVSDGKEDHREPEEWAWKPTWFSGASKLLASFSQQFPLKLQLL